ncbi:hypothetical protein HanIR_Chr15g0740241 [Helianthus annuus]|nr:hypothetical protein HanIR_Chr15g0740241 [Helianthus annuus]
MKPISRVGVLQAHDSLTNHPDNFKPHQLNQSHTNLNQKKNNRTEFFAGSAFVESPSPSSVPIPEFFSKNYGAAVPDDRDRTIEHRRLLGCGSGGDGGGSGGDGGRRLWWRWWTGGGYGGNMWKEVVVVMKEVVVVVCLNEIQREADGVQRGEME